MAVTNLEQNYAVEFLTSPVIRIGRRRYQFQVQTRFLSERQIYAEAFLRGFITGDDDVVTAAIKQAIDAQLKADHEKWATTQQDLTPIHMNYRPNIEEALQVVGEAMDGFNMLSSCNASVLSRGIQLEFAINCLKRTNYEAYDGTQRPAIEQALAEINRRYFAVCNEQLQYNRNAQNSSNAYPRFSYFQASPAQSVPIQFAMPQQQYVPHSYTGSFNAMSQPQASYNQNFQIPSYATAFQSRSQTNNQNFQAPPTMNTPQQQRQQFQMPPTAPPFSQYESDATQTNHRFSSSWCHNATPQSCYHFPPVGPHKVSATIISIISKNVYDPSMDALDHLTMWENQASSLSVPVEHFLSYMEVLLSKELQNWWQIHRPNILTWTQFRTQFLEDFGDRNRAIKADREIANLAQQQNETFQQLYLRFTRLMSHAKPEKSESDKLYILKAALKPEMRAACMYASSLAELKKMCTTFEGMSTIYTSRIASSTKNCVNLIQEEVEKNHFEEKDYWDNEIEWSSVPEEEKVLLMEENADQRKKAIRNQWTKEERKEWLKQQLCYNCNTKGHLQGQCDKPWMLHCVKCGTKGIDFKKCRKCTGNDTASTTKGANH